MTKSRILIAAVAAIVTGPVFAGEFDASASETAVTQTARGGLSDSSPDWTGFYGGAEIGFANVDTNVAGSDDDVIGGLVAGYDYDLGEWVIGGGLDVDGA